MTPARAVAGREEHALEVLEFPRILERVARYAVSEPGRRAIRALRPQRDPKVVDEALNRVDEMTGLILRFDDWSPPPIPDAEPVIRKLSTEGSILDVEQLRDLGDLLRASRVAGAGLRRAPDELPRLAGLGGRLLRREEMEARLDRSLDPNGGLADAASPRLATIRGSLRDARLRLVRFLESYVSGLPDRLRVPDASVTVRAGRYCIPVRREGMSHVRGIVHDESATHRTLFVEPPEAIERMNHIAELERNEKREIEKVLAELTDLLRPEVGDLAISLAALAEADSLYARARYGLEHGGVRPQVRVPMSGQSRVGYRAVAARHPLLPSGDEPVVPFDLSLQPHERVLLVSGPNAGGKTVLLKAIGLLSVMAQSGIIPPVGTGTSFPLFHSFFAVIGDEQSILESLSTFSAQIESLRVIMAQADAGALVLVDEIGGNTDPAEGAALAAAVLMRLAGQSGLTVATTHLGELKDLAAGERAVVNASLQFDTDALRPTFRLLRDRPGRSYALEIAHRLGLPAAVLEVARSRLSRDQRRVDGLLRDLEQREAELDRWTARARASALRSKEAEDRLTASFDRLTRRESEVEGEARRKTERYLFEAREAVEREVERLRREVLEIRERRQPDPAAFETTVHDVRSTVEGMLREVRRPRSPTPSAPAGERAVNLAVGDRVRSRSLGVEGEVIELRTGLAILEAGGKRFALDPWDLQATDEASPARREASGTSRDALPALDPVTEVDLRGLRVDEVASVMLAALDAAFVNDVPSLRIIHGKGTGALREEVSRLLDGDSRVGRFRLGGFQEGGSGVTVVELDERDD